MFGKNAKGLVMIAIMSLGAPEVASQASCAPTLAQGLSPMCGVYPGPSDCAFFDDGSGPAFYVTGPITSAGSIQVAGIARWDGAAWTDVGGGLTGVGNRLTVYDDGSGPALYAAGVFTAAGGVPATNVARWNGTSWSAVGAGLPVQLSSIVGGVVGGASSLFAGSIGTNAVFRWTGTAWIQIASADGWIETLAIEDLGSGPRLYVGGRFSTISGISASKIASFDGSSWQALGGGVGSPGFSTVVYACKALGGELFVGGTFPAAPGVSANIARWNGTTWLTAGSQLGGAAGVVDLEIFDDGAGPAVYTTGEFPWVGDFARWTGSAWITVGNGIEGGAAMAVRNTPAVPGLLGLTGGYEVDWLNPNGSIPIERVGFWNGSSWSVAGTGFNGTVRCSATWTGEMLFGGEFTQAPGAVMTNGVARWNGSVWSGLGANAPHRVTALLPSSVGGPGVFAASDIGPVSRWDGTTWQTVGSGGLPTASVMTEYPSPSGTVVVVADSAYTPDMAQWDGVNWISAAHVVSAGGAIRGLAPYPSGTTNLFIGGKFTSLAGFSQSNLACWTGASVVPPPFAWNNLEVRCMKVLDDGAGPALFIAGKPIGLSNPPPCTLYRWDGTSLGAIGVFSGSQADVTNLEIVAESVGPVLYAAGLFNVIDGLPVSSVGRRVGGTWTGVPGIASSARPRVVQGFSEGGGSVAYIGGDFPIFNGMGFDHLERFGCPRPSVALSQTGGAGSPVFVSNAALVAGRETFNVFSVQPCTPIIGSGPLLGLCASSPATLLAQAMLPIGSVPFHFVAIQTSMTFGPFSAPPYLVDVLCADVDTSSNYRWSPVTRVQIQ